MNKQKTMYYNAKKSYGVCDLLEKLLFGEFKKYTSNTPASKMHSIV